MYYFVILIFTNVRANFFPSNQCLMKVFERAIIKVESSACTNLAMILDCDIVPRNLFAKLRMYKSAYLQAESKMVWNEYCVSAEKVSVELLLWQKENKFGQHFPVGSHLLLIFTAVYFIITEDLVHTIFYGDLRPPYSCVSFGQLLRPYLLSFCYELLPYF